MVDPAGFEPAASAYFEFGVFRKRFESRALDDPYAQRVSASAFPKERAVRRQRHAS